MIHQELDDKLYGIKADQGQIEQVLFNLYVNAADAMLGNGNLFLKTKNPTHKNMVAKPYHPKPGNYFQTIPRVFEIRKPNLQSTPDTCYDQKLIKFL